jgi:hypothetical protein
VAWVVPEDDTVADGVEDLLFTDGEARLDVLVVLEDLVDVLGESLPFGIQHRMVHCLSCLHNK